ncbi:hypothetical protein MX024_05330 [Streptococcus uberis]|uniref:hypothetical protein n=1 Tax=Streptococcus uberis TaxID=1349 RepID=UPI001FF40DAE|nr:hypothetical protein [Streptococcus uberis]MCK1222344.1 hypothetical protein [Streptococcus uberis]MCK1231600.1 hypothetical protein [Streptococcus uberis]
MELSEASAYVDSLDLKNSPIDFTKFTDEQLLKTSITVDLISIDEAKDFQLELEKRHLIEKYSSMRK